MQLFLYFVGLNEGRPEHKDFSVHLAKFWAGFISIFTIATSPAISRKMSKSTNYLLLYCMFQANCSIGKDGWLMKNIWKITLLKSSGQDIAVETR